MIGSGLILFAFVGVVMWIIKKVNPEKIKEVKKEDTNGLLVVSVLMFAIGAWMVSGDDPSHGDAITQVLATIPDHSQSVHGYVTADLDDGGVAVVINKAAGYWVKDGKVFAVNGIAKNFSPAIDYAPQEITWSKVENAFN